ncbi:pyridoxal-5'-phosphate-dependent protein subunit beta, partial [Streptomyces sp. NPDC059385]
RPRRRPPGRQNRGLNPVASPYIAHPPRPPQWRALGSSIHPGNVRHGIFDEVHWVGPVEAVDACRRLARGSFVSGGWSTGAVALVSAWAARAEPGAVVATVFPDGPHRYLGTVYDDSFCHAHGLTDSTPATRPLEIPHPRAAEALGWTRCRTVLAPLAERPDASPAAPVPAQGGAA